MTTPLTSCATPFGRQLSRSGQFQVELSVPTLCLLTLKHLVSQQAHDKALTSGGARSAYHVTAAAMEEIEQRLSAPSDHTHTHTKRLQLGRFSFRRCVWKQIQHFFLHAQLMGPVYRTSTYYDFPAHPTGTGLGFVIILRVGTVALGPGEAIRKTRSHSRVALPVIGRA